MPRWARNRRQGREHFGTLENDVLHEHQGDSFDGGSANGIRPAPEEVDLIRAVSKNMSVHPGEVIAGASNAGVRRDGGPTESTIDGVGGRADAFRH